MIRRFSRELFFSAMILTALSIFFQFGSRVYEAYARGGVFVEAKYIVITFVSSTFFIVIFAWFSNKTVNRYYIYNIIVCVINIIMIYKSIEYSKYAIFSDVQQSVLRQMFGFYFVVFDVFCVVASYFMIIAVFRMRRQG